MAIKLNSDDIYFYQVDKKANDTLHSLENYVGGKKTSSNILWYKRKTTTS